mmetsp:Transcript_22261/g.52904  ORF Transcript_22261/g.52904 Transcript_22261/m.52904 type:complete len:235 (+) Transcript_22261:48-752(+)
MFSALPVPLLDRPIRRSSRFLNARSDFNNEKIKNFKLTHFLQIDGFSTQLARCSLSLYSHIRKHAIFIIHINNVRHHPRRGPVVDGSLRLRGSCYRRTRTGGRGRGRVRGRSIEALRLRDHRRRGLRRRMDPRKARFRKGGGWVGGGGNDRPRSRLLRLRRNPLLGPRHVPQVDPHGQLLRERRCGGGRCARRRRELLGHAQRKGDRVERGGDIIEHPVRCAGVSDVPHRTRRR